MIDKDRTVSTASRGVACLVLIASCAAVRGDEPQRASAAKGAAAAKKLPGADEVFAGLREFFSRTARPDGSFLPGIDPEYRGLSDSHYSDLAPVTYAVTIHKTFGWKLPFEEQTRTFLLSRQKPSGEFVNVGGTVAPDSPEGKTYNTTQALVALHALGTKPKHDPLPIFEDILKEDYKTLPAYSTSFFPLAYLCAGRPIPEKADRGIRALMIQDETGYMNDHIAATFHASHYYHLVGEATPKAHEMLARILRDQKADGSWMLNLPSRDRHATFDAVFTLRHEGPDRADCRAAVRRAADWALACRNDDGGFGHYPGSPSDADANYFQVGTLVMAGVLKPADPLPPDPHLLSWGHLVPLRTGEARGETAAWRLDGWVASVAFAPDGGRIAAACADGTVRLLDPARTAEVERLAGHADIVAAVRWSPDGRTIASGGYDQVAVLWDAAARRAKHRLEGHRGAVMAVAFDPTGKTLATGSLDGTIRLWDAGSGESRGVLEGHRTWVNGLDFLPDGTLVSGSSDGTVRLWSIARKELLKTIDATNAEVRCVAASPDGKRIAAGIRYGRVRTWAVDGLREQLDFPGHESDVWGICFARDSARLFTSNGDWNRAGHVKGWDTATGKPSQTWQHTGETTCVAVSTDGRFLAAGAGDKTVRMWRLTGER